MSNYKHGDWFCKPANEEETEEIIKRAVASGAELYDTTNLNSYYGHKWCTFYAWGVVNGQTNTGEIVQEGSFKNVKEYTIDQLRELFPLPGEQGAKWDGEGWPPVGIEVEVLHEGQWVDAITVGEFGRDEKCMVCAPNGGGFYGYYAGRIRPIRSKRDKWIEKAERAIGARTASAVNSAHIGLIYDAIKSGDLKAPEVK